MSQKYESGIRQIPYSQQRVYDKLSDLSFMQEYQEHMSQIPADTMSVENLQFTPDGFTCHIPPVGDVDLHIVEREEPKCIKFEATTSPVPLTFWIQILPTSDESSKMKLTLQTELNFFLKGILHKPISDGIEKLADTLAALNY